MPSQREWHEVFDAILPAILVVDKAWRVQRHNRAAADLFRASEEPLVGRHYGMLLHGAPRTPVDCPVARSVRSRQRERAVLERSGHRLEVTAEPIVEADETCSGVLCTVSNLLAGTSEAWPQLGAEQKFRDVFDSANVGKALTLPTGEFEVNAAMALMLGYESGELPYGSWREITHPSDIDLTERMVTSLLSGERNEVRVVKRYLHRDGSVVWADVSSVLRRTEAGEPQYFITTVVDITAQRAVEERHREAEERFAKAFFASPAGLTITRIDDGSFLDANDAFLAMMEFAREEVIGHTSTELGMWSPEERQDVIRRQLATGGLLGCELQVKTRSGRVLDLLFSSQQLAIAGEEHLVTTMVDITERKQAERALMQSEQQYRALFENMNTGFVLFEAVYGDDRQPIDLIIRSANAGFTATTGVPIDHVTDRRLTEVLPGIEHDDADWIRTYGSVARTGQPQQFERASRLLGRHYSVHAFSAGPGRCAVTFQDVTERVRMRADKDSLERQLQQAQKLESVGRLAGGVAHDFNNMLSVILGYSETLLGTLPEDSPLRADVGEILSAGRRSADLTRQLLAFSRKQTLQPEVIDLNEALIELQRMLGRILGEDIELAIEPHPTAGRVLVDPGQLQQVIVNLVANARDAMPNGGQLLIEVGDVELDERYAAAHPGVTPGRFTMLAVTDTGSGIPPEALGQVFEPFFTTKTDGQGTGLGLATTYGIVKQSGGNIWAYSEPGHGTVFKLYFPATEAAPVSRHRESGTAPAPGRGERILIVEDDASVRHFLERALRGLGYHPLVAANGREAVQMIEQQGLITDLVLTDMVMPNMSGEELVSRLRESAPGLRHLYMSGYTEHSVVRHGVLAADTPFLQKPFTVGQLAEKVSMSLADR